MTIETNTVADWHEAITAVSPAVAQVVAAVLQQHAEELAGHFYQVMMADPEAAPFLSHDTVQSHLKPGIQRWMRVLFQGPGSDPTAVAALQRHVGDVHARADIPVGLVSRGMRLLKTRIRTLLVQSELDRQGLVDAVGYVGVLMDLAFSEMSSAYVRTHESGVRTDEIFRMVTAGQNAALERHKQLGALSEWENSVLRILASATATSAVLTMRSSAFGLWVQHKAPLLFDEMLELQRITEQIQSIDATLLPLLLLPPADGAPPVEKAGVLRDFLADLEEMRFLVNAMFDRMLDMEVGRDVLTQLYNRRFLPTILRRELDMARRQQNTFGVLMIDVDHFKRVNDGHGHDAGDRVLQAIAALLLAHSRVSDFFFRYGGEEFLGVVNEVDAPHAMLLADKIRARIEQAVITISEEESLHVTVSIGVAMHTGHPDYRHLINQADAALYEAKRAGRNRVVMATV